MDQPHQDQQKKYKKRVGYRTPKRFLRNVFRRPVHQQANSAFSARPRSLGGHR